MSSNTPSLAQLTRAIQIAEQIERLESELSSLLRDTGSTQVSPTPRSSAAGKGGKRRTMSPEARERIAAAQRARWAKTKGTSAAAPASGGKPKKRKGGISAEGRARLAAAMKARWAARKRGAPALNARKKS